MHFVRLAPAACSLVAEVGQQADNLQCKMRNAPVSCERVCITRSNKVHLLVLPYPKGCGFYLPSCSLTRVHTHRLSPGVTLRWSPRSAYHSISKGDSSYLGRCRATLGPTARALFLMQQKSQRGLCIFESNSLLRGIYLRMSTPVGGRAPFAPLGEDARTHLPFRDHHHHRRQPPI